MTLTLLPLSNKLPKSATMKKGAVTNTQVTHTALKVTSEVTVSVDTTYTCVFNWDGAATDASKTSAVSTTVIADVVG